MFDPAMIQRPFAPRIAGYCLPGIKRRVSFISRRAGDIPVTTR